MGSPLGYASPKPEWYTSVRPEDRNESEERRPTSRRPWGIASRAKGEDAISEQEWDKELCLPDSDWRIGTSGRERVDKTVKRWVLSGEILHLSDGILRIGVNAGDVYQSVIDSTPPWPDLPPGRSGDAADLNFCRYPAQLRAVLSGAAGDGRAQVGFEVQTQQDVCFAVSPRVVAIGHVVHRDTWYPLTPGDGATVSSLLRKVGVDLEDGEVKTLRGLLALRKAAAHGEAVVDRLANETLLQHLFQSDGRSTPTGVRATLYPHQLDGWRWLSFIVREGIGGLLGDEMGLGKTLQVISTVRDPGLTSPVKHTLVVVPSSLLENWVRELSKFCPDLTTCKHHGAMRTGLPADLTSFDVVLTSYGTAVRDLSLLKMVDWDMVVLDEAQYIRNPDALRTRSVKEIPSRVSLAVTGTPVENSLRDLWSIIDFVLPGYLGTQADFQARYADDERDAATVEKLVSPLLLRRRIADHAGDLPERLDFSETLQLREQEAHAYELVRSRIMTQYGAAATLVSLTKLRQFCAHPELAAAAECIQAGEFTKLRRLFELFFEIFAWNEKVLVFTSWRQMADRIVTASRHRFGAGVLAETLDGRLPVEDRQPLLDRFARHRGPAVLVLNPRAGGIGLNITAANHVIHYNPEWNPAVEDQATARVHRYGQTRPVTVRRLVLAETVEEVIDERLRRKRRVAETAVVGVEGDEADYQDILAAIHRSPLSGN